MKQVLVYIHPEKAFSSESSVLARIQIDNSLDLGWKKADILLFTNFPYEYNGVTSTTISDALFCQFRPLSTKTVVVSHLLQEKILTSNEIYWVHDFDAYQHEKIRETELNLENKDLGFTDYGWSPKWSLGSYFLKPSAQKNMRLLRDTIYEHQLEDERALVLLTRKNTQHINDCYKKLNSTYNFGMRHIGHNYQLADKPLRVLHFHPWTRGHHVLDLFMHGKNELGFPLMNQRLITIFKQAGIH